MSVEVAGILARQLERSQRYKEYFGNTLSMVLVRITDSCKEDATIIESSPD